MVSFRTVALAAAAVIGITSAIPSEKQTRQTWVPYTQNTTREFYIHMVVTDGPTTYQEWGLEAYHTGAGLADPVFSPNTGTPAFFNGTNLQFDVGDYPFSFIASESDTNYARWEPTTIETGYGSGNFANDGPNGIILTDEEYDGWIVCEWFHSDNAPQLFRMIKGFDSVAGSPYTDIPCSCSRVLLFPQWI